MKYWIIDGETNIKNRGEGAVGDMAASPYYKDNKIVLWGERQAGKNYLINTHIFAAKYLTPKCLRRAAEEKVLLVGHNVCFDLKYLQKTWPELYSRVINNIYIWDTQQVAYLLSGQAHMYPALDELVLEVGGTLKDEKIKEYWENGIDTEFIPIGELTTYLEGDLENTEKVFRYQYELVSKIPALFNLVKVKMDDLLCTNMMEVNGMEFDLVSAQDLASACDKRIEAWVRGIVAEAALHFPPAFGFNPMSNEHISLLLFGGKYKLREQVPIKGEDGEPLRYKTGARKGEIKTRYEDVWYSTTGLGLTPPEDPPNAKGIYSVSDEVLQKYVKDNDTVPWIKYLRIDTKEAETYYRGYSKLVWPDNKIHPSINHCSTRTGRQSCTKPNLQNVTREDE